MGSRWKDTTPPIRRVTLKIDSSDIPAEHDDFIVHLASPVEVDVILTPEIFEMAVFGSYTLTDNMILRCSALKFTYRCSDIDSAEIVSGVDSEAPLLEKQTSVDRRVDDKRYDETNG